MKIISLIVTYIVIGLGVSYAYATGMLVTPYDQYITLIFYPSIWIWNNLLATSLGLPMV